MRDFSVRTRLTYLAATITLALVGGCSPGGGYNEATDEEAAAIKKQASEKRPVAVQTPKLNRSFRHRQAQPGPPKPPPGAIIGTTGNRTPLAD
jgi:hypothetical protein